MNLCVLFCGCACLSFIDLLAYGYAVIMLNVIRSEITIKNLTVVTSTPNTIYKSAKGQGLYPFVESPCERKNLQCNLPQMSMKHSLQNSGIGLCPRQRRQNVVAQNWHACAEAQNVSTPAR